MRSYECARRLGGPMLVGCACLAQASQSHAAWEAVPQITLAAETNDNPGLDIPTATGAPLDQASRMLADARLAIRRIAPQGELMFEPRVRGDVYAEEEAQALESTDVYLRSTGTHRGPTVRVGYTADVARERLLGVEFLGTLPDDAPIDDPAEIPTSQVGVNEERTRAGIVPWVEMALNSRSALRLDGRIVDIDYEAGAVGGRTDSFERALGGEYRRTLDSRRGTFGVRVFATGYEATVNNNVTDTKGIALTFTREVTELVSWNVSAGTQSSDFAYNSGGRRIRGTDDTPIFELGVVKRSELATMRAGLQRRMSPDELGFVAPVDEIRLTWQRSLSARVNSRVVLRGVDAEGVPDIPNSDRRYGRAEVDVEWQFRQPWSFVAGYAHETARSNTTGADAGSNILTIGVRYHGRSAQTSADAVR